MFSITQTGRRHSPYAEVQPEESLSTYQLIDMFDRATSPEACARAAKAFARSNSCHLQMLMHDTRAEVPFVMLCEHLTRELDAAGVEDPSIWNSLVETIGKQDSTRVTPQEALHLLQGCAQSMASLGVSSTYVWSTLISCVPADVQGVERLQATADIAGALTKAGIEQQVLWKDVIALITELPFQNQPHADVANANTQLRGPTVVAVLCALSFASQEIVGDKRELQLDPSMRYDTEVWVLVARIVAASATMRNDPVIWQLLIDGAMQTTKGMLPDLVRFCANVPSVAVWHRLLAAIESVGNTEGIDMTFVYQSVFGLTKDPEWLGLAMVCIRDAASRARKYDSEEDREGDSLYICNLIQKNLQELVDKLGTLDADLLLKPVVRIVLGEQFRPCEAFRRLGIKNACDVVLNLAIAAPYKHAAAYRSMLWKAMLEGTLGLDSIPQVNAHRALVRESEPSILWTAIFHPNRLGFPTRKFYNSFPKLQMNVDAFLKSLKVLVLEIGAYINVLHKKGVAPDAPERLALCAVVNGLIGLVTAPEAKVRMDQLWGKNGETDIQVDQALLSRLIRDGAINADAARKVNQSVQDLETSPGSLGQKAAAMRECWLGLTDCVEYPGFKAAYALCGDYVVAMLDPDDVANLKVGHDVACCLAPDGEQAGSLFERLAGGWILWAVKNPQGETVAVAWGALNTERELVIDFIDERVNFRPEPRGNNLVEQLIAFAPVVAETVNARAAWLAPARYGRLEGFEAFVLRPTEPKSFEILIPEFLGVSMYTDSLNEGEIQYALLTEAE